MTFGLIPACGRSTRMGRPKLSLPFGGRTVIECVVAALRDGGADSVLAVVGPHVPELEPLCTRAGARVLALPEPTADMRATVEAGLGWLDAHFRPAPTDRWLLSPGDHPTLSPTVVRALLDAAATDADRSLFVPVFEGRRSHPLLASWRHAASVAALPEGEGINALIHRNRDAVREVTVADAGGLPDFDTPDEYARLTRQAGSGRPARSDLPDR